MKQELIYSQKKELPKGWIWSTLGEECEINPRRSKDLEVNDNKETSFVPMEVVDGNRGIISEIRIVAFSKVKKGYTYFEENDVLFAKITPCMQNKKSAIAKGLISGYGFGTTEFHVLRCKDKIIPKWVYYFIRNQRFIDDAENNFTGAVGQQRVPASFLKEYPIIVPSIVEQQQIVDKLDKQMAQIETMKKEAEKEIEATTNLFKSCLISFFKNIYGKDFLIRDLITYDQSGFACAINTLVTSDGYAHLRPFNIGVDGKFNMNTIYQVPSHMVDGKKYYLSKGDILFNNTNSIELVGKSALADNNYPYAFSNHINKIKVKETLIKPEFFQYNLIYLWLTNYFANNCKKWIGQAGFTVNKLKELSIKVPSYEEQERIVNILRNKSNIVEQNKIYLQIQLDAINQLPASVLNEVFGQYQINS